MSVDEAVAKIGAGYQISHPKLNGSVISVTVAAKPESDVWVLEAVNGKIEYLSHHIKFPPGGQPNLPDTNKRVYEKYGKAFTFSPNFAWNDKGVQITDQTAGFNCKRAMMEATPIFVDVPNRWNETIPGLHNMLNTCSYLVSAGYAPTGPGNQLVGALSIQVMDVRPFYTAALQQQQIKNAETQKQLDKSKQNVAPF